MEGLKLPFWQFFRMGWDGCALSIPQESFTGNQKLFLFRVPIIP
jgi:hypothetical protein